MIYIIFIVFAIFSYIVQNMLQSRMKKYSQVPMPYGLTGKDIAERMLRENGINNVTVTHVGGTLTDHYNPTNRTINLSDGVYNSCSIAAAAVAAHETGHALQHAMGYAPLKLRSSLVPVVNFASSWMQWVLLIGIFTIQSFPQIMIAGIILFGITTLFSIVTLPVEINASQRALAWLNTAGITNTNTHPMAKDALKWAAYTYVVAALSSLATLVYYILMFIGNSDD
ncbi:MAG: zinc metallopeptidase [Bacteroidaceae bacterium]|nr:zinc metallopeptidase [Bacteroidaceae bacterium]